MPLYNMNILTYRCFRLTQHPEVHPAVRKELYWWSQYRHLINATLGDYSDLFTKSTAELTHEIMQHGNNQHVLGEFTSMTFFDFSHWREDPRNKGYLEPLKTPVHDLMSVLPDVKLIVILRNPTTRFYSNFKMFRKSGSPQTFHRYVLGSIEWWNNCLSRLPERNCAFGSPPGMPPVYDKIGNRNEWWRHDRNYSGEIRHGMYGIMVNEWLNVVPRENMLFIKLEEEYSPDLEHAYRDIIFPFLGLQKLEQSELTILANKHPSYKRKYSPMLEETKVILDEFYKPFNERLAKALGDDKWLWQ